MIELTVPAGELTEYGRRGIQREPGRLLQRWEGAPDAAPFRASAGSCRYEPPAGARVTAEVDAARFRVTVAVPAGRLSERRKSGLVSDVTHSVLDAAGLGAADAGRVLIHEQPKGTRGVGGQTVRCQEPVALATASRTGIGSADA